MAARPLLLAALVLALPLWTPTLLWAAPDASASSPPAPAQAGPHDPAPASQEVSAIALRRYGPAIPLAAEHGQARASAWLVALRKAATALPRGREFRMGAVSPAERLALAAQLYTVKDVTPAYSARPEVEVRLALRPEAGRDLAQALRNPELTQLRHAFILETRAALEDLDRLRAVPEPPHLRSEDWERMGARLEGLWQAQAALELTPEGWLTSATSLAALEEAARQAPHSPSVRLLLAEAQLQRNLPQQSVDSCTTALRSAPDLSRARYIRALALWRLQQLALAEDDLNASLDEHSGPPPHSVERARRLRARGAVRMLRRDYSGMCADFADACALGDCDGLAAARARKLCLPGATTPPGFTDPTTMAEPAKPDQGPTP